MLLGVFVLGITSGREEGKATEGKLIRKVIRKTALGTWLQLKYSRQLEHLYKFQADHHEIWEKMNSLGKCPANRNDLRYV